MEINLSDEIAEHFERLKGLSDDAAENASGESLSGRAAAMSALTGMLRDLIKSQAEVINMGLIQHLQASVVEALGDYDQKIKDKVVAILEERLKKS